MTSHDVVARCRRLFGQKRVGHAGTLDPDATGVLLVGLGRATRLLQFQSGLRKSYCAQVVLGVATTTLDAAGEVTGRWDQGQVSLAEARRAAALSHRPHLAGPADGLGREGGRPAAAPTGPAGHRGRAGRPGGHRLALRCGVAGRQCGRRVSGPGRQRGMLLGDLRPGSGRRSGCGPGRRRPPPSIAPNGSRTLVDRLSRPTRCAHGCGPSSRPRPRSPGWTSSWCRPVASSEVQNGRVLERADLGVGGDGPWRISSPGGELLAVYVPHPTDRNAVKPVVVLAEPGS